MIEKEHWFGPRSGRYFCFFQQIIPEIRTVRRFELAEYNFLWYSVFCEPAAKGPALWEK